MKKCRYGVAFDPRTKLLLILLCVFCSIFAADLQMRFFLVLLVGLFGVVSGKLRYALISTLCYGGLCLVTLWTMAFFTGTLQTMFTAFFGLLHKVYACGMLAGIIIGTTKVNEFMAAMTRLRCPRKIAIPFAVMLRYLPVIREDWHFIKDAMKMRDVSPSLWGFLRSPAMTVHCIYVPLLTAASRAADELSVAAVTRGIESPGPRSCLTEIGFHLWDWGVTAVFAAFLFIELL